MQADNETNKIDIANIKTEQTTQDTNISALQIDNTKNKQDITAIKATLQSLEGIGEGDESLVATILNLQTTINTKADKKKVYEVTIDIEGWEGTETPYTKTIQVEGIKEVDVPDIKPVWSNDIETRKKEKESYNKLSRCDTVENGILLTCDEEKPQVPVNVRVEVIY